MKPLIAPVLVVMGALTAVLTAGAAIFSETFPGSPPAPLAFESAHWSTTIHNEWGVPLNQANDPGQAHHTASCGNPGETGLNTHTVQAFDDLVFACADHVMTHIPSAGGGGYAAIYLTPDQMIDLSGPSATLRLDVSTLATSTRDWIDVWVQAWDTQEQGILDEDIPTAQGNPRNAVHIEMGGAPCVGAFRAGEGEFHVEVYDANRAIAGCVGSSGRWIDVLTPSAVTRSTVEVVFTPGHIKVWMPQNGGLVLSEGAIPALGFTEGVVSLGHHSYSPDKGAEGGQLDGRHNSWHWDNVTIDPAIPFAIIATDHRGAFHNDPASARTFTFASPAPANALLRFEAFSEGAVLASFNGAPAVAATRTSTFTHAEQAASYVVPVPLGATNVRVDLPNPTFGFVGAVVEVEVFARSTAAPSPTPTATATPTSTASPTPTPTATATPTPTPTPPPALPCRVEVRRNGTSGGWVYDELKGSYTGTLVAGECRR